MGGPSRYQATTYVCGMCGQWYRGFSKGGLCPDCRRQDELDQDAVEGLMEKGHPYHCACRQVFGDGGCECDLYEKGYDPDGWMKRVNGGG